jgi:HSP20 family protein
MKSNKRTDVAVRTQWRLFDDFDRIFRDFRLGTGDFFRSHRSPALLPRDGTGVRRALVDLKDTGTEFVVKAELPGVAKEDLDVEVTQEGVELKAKAKQEREEEEEGYYLKERSYQSWHRWVPFPSEVLPDKAEAELEEGVLTLRAPKKEASTEGEGRKVPVK